MLKLWFFLLFFIVTSGQPTFSQNQSFRINTSLAFHSERFLGLQNEMRSSEKGTTKFNIKYDTDNSVSQLALNYDGYDNLNLDGSYFQYTKGIATYGVGAVDRHWSFSNKASLILSHNARPSKSIFLELKNRFGYNWLPPKANWSIEVFNGFTEGSLNSSESMLLGARVILSPIEGLDFELLQTSQWGGKAYSSGISALGAALFFDTNDNSNANINKMSGFGISYLIPSYVIPLRIYGQAVGEDEAGNLPSCYAYLAGIEWTNSKNKYPIIIGIEAIDTRIDKTSHGNCGPNTMYNNNTYQYTNYGNTMGATIDTEGTSYELFGKSQISQKINIEYSTKILTVNDHNWSGHRLSSKRETGLVNSLGVSWSKNNIKFNVNIYNQDYTLDKADIKNSSGLGFYSSVIF
tara:strand:+ start:968 stop:2185 length:1218 start_codon:yes stop_codon:yes gene_type:complete